MVDGRSIYQERGKAMKGEIEQERKSEAKERRGTREVERD